MNEDLIRQVMTHIRANSERWDQRSYVGGGRDCDGECCTTHCFAGWAMRLSGIGHVDGWFRVPEGHRAFGFAARTEWADPPVAVMRGSGAVRDEFEVARQLCGLEWGQARQIFHFFSADDCPECEVGTRTNGLEIFVRHVAHVTGLEGL